MKLLRVSHLLLLLTYLLAVQAQMRRGISTTSFSGPTVNDDDEDPPLPPYAVRPFEKMMFVWEKPVNLSGRYFLNATLNFTNGIYVAVGFRSDKKMNGPIIVCAVNTTTGRASCNDFYGVPNTYAITLRPVTAENETQITAAYQIANVKYITFSKLVIDPSSGLEDIQLDGYSRWIFSRGQWYPTNNLPSQHTTDNQLAVQIDFSLGLVSSYSTNRSLIVVIVCIVFGVVIVLGMALVKAGRFLFNHDRRLIAAGALLAIYVALIIAYIGTNYADYIASVAAKAFFRAVGDGAVLIFSSMMFPVTRRIFQSTFGIPPERAIQYHAFAGCLLVIVTAVHAIGMLRSFSGGFLAQWKDKDAVSNLPGIFAFIFLIAIVVISLMRNIGGSYRLHRLAHYMYLPCIFFACCHATSLIYGLVPTAVFLVLSFVHRRFGLLYVEEHMIASAVADKLSDCTILDIVRNDYISPGAWYMVTLHDISTAQHPVFVTSTKLDQASARLKQTVRFVIKNTAAVKGLRHDPLMPNSWTSLVFDHFQSGKPTTTFDLDGPFGLLEIDPYSVQNFILVAGGIGVCPWVNLLRMLSASPAEDSSNDRVGPKKMKTNLLFMWVIPNVSLLHVFADELADCCKQLPTACVNLKFSLKIWVTNSAPIAAPEKALVLPKEITVLHNSRPNWKEEMEAFERQQSLHFITVADGRFTTKNRGYMYCCGPPPLMDGATAAAKDLKELVVDYCHQNFVF